MVLRTRFGDHEPRRPRGDKLGRDDNRIGNRQETRAAKKLRRLGVRKQRGSGNQHHAKGDLEGTKPESFLGECKTTDKRHLPISMSWLRKITREARGVRKTPILVFGFEGMTPPTPKDWAAIPLEAFEQLIAAAGWDMEVRKVE